MVTATATVTATVETNPRHSRAERERSSKTTTPGGYDGDITDEHGQDEVVVEVGAGDNGFQFAPAGLAVDVGTTVVWEWTGRGGGHNVVSEPGSDFEVESERTDEEGFTFEQTFDEEGVLLYVCTPHRAQGKYGAVVVE